MNRDDKESREIKWRVLRSALPGHIACYPFAVFSLETSGKRAKNRPELLKNGI